MGVSQRLPRLTDQERIALDDLLVTIANPNPNASPDPNPNPNPSPNPNPNPNQVTVAADLAKCEKLISTR